MNLKNKIIAELHTLKRKILQKILQKCNNWSNNITIFEYETKNM